MFREMDSLALWHAPFAKYAGAAIDLTFGYVPKYVLDRRFVISGA